LGLVASVEVHQLVTHENDSRCLLVQLCGCFHLFGYIKWKAKAGKTTIAAPCLLFSISRKKKLHSFSLDSNHGLPP
jgi:hypothetical protein